MPAKKHAAATKAAAAQAAKKDNNRAKKEHRKHVARLKDYASSEEKAFLALLNDANLTIKYMDGDGNCLFRSVADQLTGNADGQHPDVRRKVMDYIEAHKDHFSLFIEDDEPFDDYVARMRETREWGGDKELFAASQLFAVNVVVHQADAARPRYVLRCDHARRDIHLSYHGDCHYNSVRSVGDDGTRMGPAAAIRLDGLDTGLAAASSSASSSTSSSATVDEQAVLRCVPWQPLEDVRRALRRAEGDVDAAVELLMLNPDGLGNEPTERLGDEPIEGDEADSPEMPPPPSPSPAPAPAAAPAPAPAPAPAFDKGRRRSAPVRTHKVVVAPSASCSRKDRRRQAKEASAPPPPPPMSKPQPQQHQHRPADPPVNGVIYL